MCLSLKVCKTVVCVRACVQSCVSVVWGEGWGLGEEGEGLVTECSSPWLPASCCTLGRHTGGLID